MDNFRFEDLSIWKDAISIGKILFEIAGKAEDRRKYRFAEQLNGSILSISNNIAEGSGSSSNKEFARYLSIARSSIFEVVNILHVFEQQGIITANEREEIYPDLLKLSKSIYKFRVTLLKNV